MKLTISSLTALVKDRPEIPENLPYRLHKKDLTNALRYSRAFMWGDKPVGIPAVLILNWMKSAGADSVEFTGAEIVGKSRGSRVTFKVYPGCVPAPEWDKADTHGFIRNSFQPCSKWIDLTDFPLSQTPVEFADCRKSA